MNYATLRVGKGDQHKALQEALALFDAKTPLSPKLRLEDDYGEIVLKQGCPIPFFRKDDRLVFYSVASCGLQRHGNEAWKKYEAGWGCEDAYTYLATLFKMCMCQALDQKLNDDGAGKWRESIRAPKFASLQAWRAALKKPMSIIPRAIRTLSAIKMAKQDKKFFPELQPEKRRKRSAETDEMSL